MTPLETLRHHVTGAIERGKGKAIAGMPATIHDDQQLIGASMHDGSITIPIYDDGSGPLWILRDSMGIQGIVRCDTWEEAYSIAEDELLDDCDLSMDEIVKEYGFKREHVKMIQIPGQGEVRPVRDSDYIDGKLPIGAFVRWETRETPDPEAWSENELFCEAYGFRPNGLRDASNPMSFIYAKDLNGEALDALTPSLVAELGITLNLENW
jgi:hypothetical protein